MYCFCKDNKLLKIHKNHFHQYSYVNSRVNYTNCFVTVFLVESGYCFRYSDIICIIHCF